MAVLFDGAAPGPRPPSCRNSARVPCTAGALPATVLASGSAGTTTSEPPMLKKVVTGDTVEPASRRRRLCLEAGRRPVALRGAAGRRFNRRALQRRPDPRVADAGGRRVVHPLLASTRASAAAVIPASRRRGCCCCVGRARADLPRRFPPRRRPRPRQRPMAFHRAGRAGKLVLGVGSLLVAAGCAAFVALNRHRVDFSATLLATVAHLVRVYPGMLARPRRLPRPARLARPLELRRRLHRDPAIPGAQRAQFGAIRRPPAAPRSMLRP